MDSHTAVAAEHVAEHAEHATPHVLNWVGLLAQATREQSPAVSEFLTRWESAIFSSIVVALIAFASVRISKNLSIVPGRLQVVAEAILGGLNDLVCSIMGACGRAYTPFVGSLFIYILVTNLYGLIPLQNSSTAQLTTTAPLAICVFFYVQFVAIKENGFVGYVYHLAGSPKSVAEWLFLPLNLPLHVMGEFIKPVTLMFRLYGNIMAGHILVAVFLQLGLQMLRSFHVPIGVPLHLPFLFLEILVGAIQAFVFALLSTVYISMMLPHEHHEEPHTAGERAPAWPAGRHAAH